MQNRNKRKRDATCDDDYLYGQDDDYAAGEGADGMDIAAVEQWRMFLIEETAMREEEQEEGDAEDRRAMGAWRSSRKRKPGPWRDKE